MINKQLSKLNALNITLIVYSILYAIHFIYINFSISRSSFYISDVFFYVLVLFTLLGSITLAIFKKSETFTISISLYKMYLTIYLILLIFYFMSSYIQSIYLIDQTIYIIEDKIIRGNPLLYLNFSGVNLTTLTFVNSILRGINSPLILFFMSIWIQQLHASSHKIACLPEKPVLKDPFLYRYPLFSLWFTLSLTSFLSINLITLNYSLTILIEMIFSTTTFVLAVMGMLFSYQWKQSNGYAFSPSKSSYKHQIAFIILKVHIMFTVLLLIYHLIGIYLDHDYGFRFVNVILSIISQIALYLIHKRLHAID